MGLFGRNVKSQPGEQDDQSWLSAGHQRFDRDKARVFGSPETLRHGGEEALGRGDAATAVFFFAKAIDVAQTWSSNRAGQRSSEDDVTLFRLYVDTIRTIRRDHPDADVLSDWCNENGKYTANMMVSVAKNAFQEGMPVEALDAAINDFVVITGMPVPGHW